MAFGLEALKLSSIESDKITDFMKVLLICWLVKKNNIAYIYGTMYNGSLLQNKPQGDVGP